MSSMPGKRPLSHVVVEAEINGIAMHNKRRRERERRPLSSPSMIHPLSSSSLSSSFRRDQTVFRILCPGGKTGSVIGKGGSIIQSIRRDTGAMVRIEDAVIGCDERVVSISAKEEGFKPQKFRGPGNYRKGMCGKVLAREKDVVVGADDGKDITAGGGGGGDDKVVHGKDVVGEEVGKDVHGKDVVEEEERKVVHGNVVVGEEESKVVGKEEGKLGVGEEQEQEKVEYLSDTDEENQEHVVHNGEDDAGKDHTEDGHEKEELNAYSTGIAPVQEALLRVHLRIMEVESSNLEENVEQHGGEVCTRLLVPTTQVGCLLGKRGKIISQIRQDSRAQIRVLPRNQIPLCALPTDELVQITGDLIAIKKALLAVSTQLRNNPPKKESEDVSVAPSKLSHPVENTFMGGNILPNNAMMGRPLSPRLTLGEKEDVTFRILCPKDKIGSIIGKGGSIVRSIRDETGAKISIDVSSDVGDERVVRVSAPEVPEDPFSKAQKAVMIIHSKILVSDPDKDGTITTKLLVPADQAGCLLGRGGYIMIEMRKMTRAKIHIHGKERLPPCAAHTDELVEIVGNFTSSQEALMQITTKLRNNLFLTKFGPTYMDSKPPPFSGLMSQSEIPLSVRAPIMPVSAPYDSRYTPYSDISVGYNEQPSLSNWPPQDFGGKMFSDLIGMGHSRDYLGDTRASTAFIASQTVEVVVPEHAIASIVGDSGSNMQQICKISGAKVKLRSLIPGSNERIVEISGTPDQTHAAQSLLQAFVLSGQ